MTPSFLGLVCQPGSGEAGDLPYLRHLVVFRNKHADFLK